jgi:hypothetical protein|tara:strand:- start:191 stop:463 length:273 start_codon:yes stop_codon:yes gene_type:complete
MKMEEIQKEIMTMNKSQLDTLIQSMLSRKNSLTNELSNFFKVGMKVNFGRRKDNYSMYEGVVSKINRTKAIVKTDRGNYTVPLVNMKEVA